MIDNVNNIVAMELLSAAQGVDFHHPRRSSKLLEQAHKKIRELSPTLDTDRSLKPDIDAVSSLIDSGYFGALCGALLPSYTE
jgi:histidine ammonia-lyase